MVIVFRCSQEAKEILDNLLREGSYDDYSDIINLALVNFAALSAEVGVRGSIVLSSGDAGSATEISEYSKHLRRVTRMPEPVLVGDEKSFEPETDASIPPLFACALSSEPPIQLASLPGDVFFSGQEVPVDRWIFGQYSKLLPAKASCRAVANLLLANQVGLPLEKLSGHIAREASTLGQYLKALDERLGLIRDDALSTGFPVSGENGDKSRLRFANQFVASMSNNGRLSGLLVDLKLVNITSERSRRIQLTKPGWVFANLANPILDSPHVQPSERLSQEERRFLLDHISSCVPVEDYAYRAILSAILKGYDKPELLDSIVKELPSGKQGGLSGSFVTTQRSGLVSRMVDLGLVSRVRDGVRVSYVVTDIGVEYARS